MCLLSHWHEFSAPAFFVNARLCWNVWQSRGLEGASALSPEEMPHAAAALGYGGVKYFDLRQVRTTDYEFNYDRMLNPDGDTAVYLEVRAFGHLVAQGVSSRYENSRACGCAWAVARIGTQARLVLFCSLWKWLARSMVVRPVAVPFCKCGSRVPSSLCALTTA